MSVTLSPIVSFARKTDGWIGLSEPALSPGAYRWLDESYPEWSHWGPGYPNAASGECVVMTTTGEWKNVQCDLKVPFLCFTLESKSCSPLQVLQVALLKCG